GARPHTFLAVLDRWDGWQTTIEAYVAEFADADPVSLAVVATPPAGADAERMFADVSALLADLGRDPAAIPDLSLLVAEAEPALYRMADCLISAGGGRRDAEAAACGLPRIAPGEGMRERLRWACGHADAAADAARRERAAVIERHGYESGARRLAAALAAA